MQHSIPRSRTTWDSDLVLNHTDDQGQNETLSTIQLSRKLTMLMSLVLGQRGQALHDLDIRNMSISESMVSFSLWDLLKTSRPGVHFSELTFDGYIPNKQLCVYITLKSYLNVRGSETRLFLTSSRSVASRDTFRSWTKDMLQTAHIDLNILSPHFTGSAASSKATLKLSVATVISTVGRSTESTFAKFYRKRLGTPTWFAEAVLSTEL